MSIRTGTRVEQLQALRNRARHQLHSAIRREEPDEAQRLRDLLVRLSAAIGAPPATPKRPRKPQAGYLILAELGVDSHTVKAWAVEQGLLPAVVRGRISTAIVELYREAHSH